MERLVSQTQKRTLFGVCLLILMFQAASVFAEEAPQIAEQAMAHYQRGRQLEADGDLVGALAAYEQAQQLRPVFRMHRHLGRVCRGMGRYRQALEHFELFIAEGGEAIEPERLRGAQQAIDELRRLVATINVVAIEGSSLSIDGDPAGSLPLDQPAIVSPGHHVIRVSLDGYIDDERHVELEAGQNFVLEVELDPVPDEDVVEPDLPDPVPDPVTDPNPRRRLRPLPFWAAVGSALSTFAIGAVFGGLSMAEASEFEALNRDDRTDAQNSDLLDIQQRGMAFSIAADVLLFTGIACAVAALVVSFFTRFRQRASAQDESRGHLGYVLAYRYSNLL